MSKRLTVAGCLLIAGFGLFMALPTRAASLQLVTNNWGASGVPTNLSMYIYVPDKLATNPPILVLLHYWGGGAGGVFAEAQAAALWRRRTSMASSWSSRTICPLVGTQGQRNPSRTTAAVRLKGSPRW